MVGSKSGQDVGHFSRVIAIVYAHVSWHLVYLADIAIDPQRVATPVVPPPTAEKVHSRIKLLQISIGTPLVQDGRISREKAERVFRAFILLFGGILAENGADRAQVSAQPQWTPGVNTVLRPGFGPRGDQIVTHAVAGIRRTKE